jgi:hypothetical protein
MHHLLTRSLMTKHKLCKKLVLGICLLALLASCGRKWDGDADWLYYSKRTVIFDPATGDVVQSIEHNRNERIGVSLESRRKTVTFYRNDQENYVFHYVDAYGTRNVSICDSTYSCYFYKLNSNTELCRGYKPEFGSFYFVLVDGQITDDFNCYEYVFF